VKQLMCLQKLDECLIDQVLGVKDGEESAGVFEALMHFQLRVPK
jgi:hypothetical protein